MIKDLKKKQSTIQKHGLKLETELINYKWSYSITNTNQLVNTRTEHSDHIIYTNS